jgi:hypothetical protein
LTILNAQSTDALQIKAKKKDKDVPVTDCGCPQGCEMWRHPHFLNHRLINGSEVDTHHKLRILCDFSGCFPL